MSAAPPPAGIVTGLVAEADCLRGATLQEAVPIVFCSGGSAQRARDGARQLAGDGVAGLVSFGVAGGLDPHLQPGTILLPHFVLAEDGTRYETAREWRERLFAEARGKFPVVTGMIVGCDRPVLGAPEKCAAFEETGAGAVDMESHAVAEVARETGLPFLAVRAIADPASRSVPRWALAGIGPEGQTRPLAVLGKIAFRPWEWPALFHLARDTAAAMAALRRVADLRALLSVPL